MHKICEVQKGINNIKTFLAGTLNQHVKEKKRFCDDLETKNTTIKLLIFNFKQLADFIGKSNANLSLLQNSDFSKNENLYSLRGTSNKSKSTNIISTNHNQLLKPILKTLNRNLKTIKKLIPFHKIS